MKVRAINQYADLGWPLVINAEKAPVDKNWGELNLDFSAVQERLDSDDSLNIGVCLGPASGLIDIECDSKQAEEDFRRLFDGVPITKTLTYKSKRGKHRVFKYDKKLENLKRSVIHYGELEVRTGCNGKATQSLLPPSETDGFKRRWSPGLGPKDVKPAELPKEVITRLLDAAKPKRRTANRETATNGEPIYKEGRRNNTLFSLGRMMRDRGMVDVAVGAALWEENKHHCDPPLDEEELLTIVRSVVGYVPEGVTTEPNDEQEEITAISLAECKEVFNKYLHLIDDTVVDIVLASVVGNHLDGDPLWLAIVGPPGDGKTQVIRCISGHSEVYTLSTFTPQALISGFQLEGGEDPSILPDMNGKLVSIKDLTVLLQMRGESRHEVFSSLRDIYDGEAAKGFGSGEKVKRYKSKFNILAGSTAAIERQADLNQQLGERFLRYHLPIGDTKSKIRKSLDNQKNQTKVQEELTAAALGFLKDVNRTRPSVPKRLENATIDLADFLATARTTVRRDRSDKDVVEVPVPETGTRVANQLLRFGLGVAMVRGKQVLSEEELGLMVKAAFDTMPSRRRILLRRLFDIYAKGFLSTKDIARPIKLPTASAKRALEELRILGLVDSDEVSQGRAVTYRWRLSEERNGAIGRIEKLSKPREK